MVAQSEPSLRLHLLGELQASYRGQPYRIAAPERSIALLAYLAVHRRASITRDRVAFALWPDETEEDARVKLRHALYRLTKALPPAPDDEPWISADLEALQWNAKADVWLDIESFERLCASARDRGSAVELYLGQLAEGIYDDWVLAHRDRLNALYLDTLGALVADALSDRDFARTALVAQRLLAADPWREDTIRSLMTARYEGGDRAAALFAYSDFARRLKSELDVEPMPETQALYEAIARNERISPDSVDRPHDAQAKPDSMRRLPFVGRAAEIEKLRTMWARAARGRGGIAFVSGEAGIGKSRLATELTLIVQSQGGRALIGATTYPESVPYQALAGALRSAGPILAALSVEQPLLALVARIVPDLRARRPDLPDVPEFESGREQSSMLDAVATALEALAQARPMLVVLEDLHWAGTATLAAIEIIARRVSEHSILVVGTYRTSELQTNEPLRKLSAQLRRDGDVSNIGLSRLTIDDIGMALESVEVAGRDRADLATQLYGYSEGNPLFLSAAVRELEPSRTGLDHAEGGPTAIIGRLLSGLSLESSAVAEVASVVGQAFDVDTVCSVSGSSEGSVIDAIGELLDRGLVREAGARTDYDFAFAHHLIRDALYARVDHAVTRQRHRLVARALMRGGVGRSTESAAEIALHLDRAGDASACQWYAEAANHALSVYALDEALAQAKRGLALMVEPEARFNLVLLREGILHSQGERAAQKAELDEIERLADSIGTPRSRFEHLSRLGRWQRAGGDRSAENEIADRLDALAEEAASEELIARALVFRADGLSQAGDYGRARSQLERAAAIFERIGKADALCGCVCEIVNLAAGQGSFDELPALVARAQSLATGGSQHSVLRALASAARAAFAQHQFAASLALQIQRLELAHRLGDRSEEAEAERGAAAAAQGSQDRANYEESQKHRRRAIALYERLGDRQGAASVRHDDGVLLLSLGRLAEARAAMEEVSAEFERLGYGRGTTISLVNLSAITVLLGDFHAAKPTALKAVELARSMQLRFPEVLALENASAACRGLRETDEALRWGTECVAVARGMRLDAEIAAALETLALALIGVGRFEEARTAIDESLGIVRRTESGIRNRETAYWSAAQVYRLLGKTKRSLELLSEAETVLRARLSELPDDASREAYLRLPFSADIEAAIERGVWPAS